MQTTKEGSISAGIGHVQRDGQASLKKHDSISEMVSVANHRLSNSTADELTQETFFKEKQKKTDL